MTTVPRDLASTPDPRAAFARRAWPDMVALYAVPGIPALCLRLQSDHDADVPLMLVLAMADHAGLGASTTQAEQLVAIAADWRRRAVLPLRAARSALKDHCATPEETALRDRIKSLELEAERLQVARLVQAFALLPGPVGLAAAYLDRLGVPRPVAADAIAVFAAGLDTVAARPATP